MLESGNPAIFASGVSGKPSLLPGPMDHRPPHQAQCKCQAHGQDSVWILEKARVSIKKREETKLRVP